MKLVSMNFIETDGEAYPSTITVSMSIDEAAAIATMFGRLNGHGMKRLGVSDAGDGPYECLVGDVFNRYWDDGLRDVRPGRIDLATINDPLTEGETT